MKDILIITLILLIPCYSMAFSYGEEKKIQIKDVEIIGNERLDYQTIYSYAKIKVDGEIDDNDIDIIIKNLYKTGLFSETKVYINENKHLIIEIKESPIVNNIIIKGNHAFSDKDLKNNILQLKSLAIFTNAKLKNDLLNLISTYRNNGKLGVKIQHEIIKLENNKINIVLKINEGRTSRVKGINFIGNKTFSDIELKQIISSKEYKSYKFFISSTKYLPERLMLDKALISYFYSMKGYLDITIKSSITEFDDSLNAYLTFLIEEGTKYNIGTTKISIDSQLQSMEQEIIEMLKTKTGQIFNIEMVSSTTEEISKYLNNKGYIFAKIEPEYNKHENIVDIDYKISIDSKAYINKISIDGNNRTLDRVIRRQLNVSEGDAYNISMVQKSRKNLINTGFFELADIESSRVQNDLVDLNINVKEKSTGNLQIGGGFSSASGLMGTINIKERNLFGTGKEISFLLEKTALSFSSNIDFTENYFFDSDASLGLGLFFSSQAQSINSNFSSNNSGFIARLSYNITDDFTQSLRYSYKYNNIENVKADASIFIKEQEGKNIDSSIGHTLTYNKLDNIFRPRDGYLLRLSQDLSGLGGTLNYVKSEVSLAYFKPILTKISDDIILRFKGSVGHAFSYSDEELKIGQRFFIGMNEIRGFNLAGIGPRDLDTKDALGGKSYFVGTTQVDFPIGLPKYADIKGSLFIDCGTLFGLDYKNKNYSDDKSLRISAGFGFSWSSPLGPMRLDFGFPLAKESYDLEKVIRFSVDTGI